GSLVRPPPSQRPARPGRRQDAGHPESSITESSSNTTTRHRSVGRAPPRRLHAGYGGGTHGRMARRAGIVQDILTPAGKMDVFPAQRRDKWHSSTLRSTLRRIRNTYSNYAEMH